MIGVQIITTSDGSHSLINTDLQETYHSVHGAIQESKHVFINAGFTFWADRNPGKKVRILEMGFGTGLNALLTLLECGRTATSVHYESWEMLPLELPVVRQLNYGSVLDSPREFLKLHEVPWEQPSLISPGFTLHKHEGDIQHVSWSDASFDIIFYDAFAPGKQPYLWSTDLLRKITNTLVPGGVWVTYCAKGQVKRDLRSFGLTVETLPGAPGKKEMIRAAQN
jgi:tRNA U34 5-methylaminomethyl-2-thiouridine-forming methyltransferase MnmC